jgi:hemolysin D
MGGPGRSSAAKTVSSIVIWNCGERQEFIYSSRISLDETKMQIEDKMVNLAPGMAVTIEVKTGTRRIIEYLMSPLLRYRQESLRER